MSGFREQIDVVEVPRNTGMDGFLRTVRTLLSKPKVQEINIDARGKIRCKRYVREDEEDVRNAGIDFEDLSPAAVVRNTQVEEVPILEGASSAVVLGALFDTVSAAQLTPVAFVTGAGTSLWDWYKTTTGTHLRSKTTLHGLPLYTDRNIPDTALLLTAAYGKNAALVDARNTFKIEMPRYELPGNDVRVMI